MEKLRVGIVGMGKMGLLHAGILNSLPQVKLSAVADTEKLITNFIKKNTPQIEVYDDYKKMIKSSKIDLLYITTPVSSHVPIALFTAQNDIPFFVEKPLGRNSKECISLCDMVNNHKVINMVGFYLRYADTFVKAKALLENGSIGKLKAVRSSVYQTQVLSKNSGWRFRKEVSGGGVLIDVGSHLIDLLSWFFGKIGSVTAFTKSEHAKEIEDSASAEILLESGLKCSFEASWTLPNYRLQETTIEIEGEYGTIKVNEDYVKINYNSSEKQNTESIFYRQALSKGVLIDIGGPEYTREDLDFVNSIKTGKQSMLNIINSSNIQCVIDSMYQSAKTKKSQKVVYIE